MKRFAIVLLPRCVLSQELLLSKIHLSIILILVLPHTRCVTSYQILKSEITLIQLTKIYGQRLPDSMVLCFNVPVENTTFMCICIYW